jgi:WD40 repeat protein
MEQPRVPRVPIDEDEKAVPASADSARAESVTSSATAAKVVKDFDIYPVEGREYSSKHVGTLGDGQHEIFSIRFDPTDKYLAAGCGDGTIRVFSLATMKEMFVMQSPGLEQPAVTCVRWRPHEAKGMSKNVLLTVNAQGLVQHWLTSSCKVLHTTAEPAMLFCADYTIDGSMFATAGDDKLVSLAF